MTYLTYITEHLLPSWVRQWTFNFKVWSDLMTNNYEPYANPYAESSAQECYEWFWSSINMDETLPKELLEGLYQMMDDIDTGIVRTIPADKVLSRMKELVDMED